MKRSCRVPAVRRRAVSVTVALVVAVSLLGSASGSQAARAITPDPGGSVKINEIQVVGSHNSYHLEATPAESAIRQAAAPVLQLGLEYEHPALGVQFDSQAIRQIELDVHADPAGGYYSTPAIRPVAGEPALPASDLAILDQPGTKVLHAADVDYRSSCLSLVICLQQVKDWSDAHPNHVPIAILLEFVDDPIPVVPSPPAVVPIPWNTTTMPLVDTEIHSVFDNSRIITPDDLKGGYATVNAGALAGNWPTLADARGKVLFLMDNGGQKRLDYLSLHPGLAGAPIFTNSTPGADDAAFIERNDPTGANQAQIAALVNQGYVVRTRADADTIEARANQTTTRDAAFASGAQWVSTDYPVPGSASRYNGSPYYAALPSGTVARCNPVNGPQGCVNDQLDLEAQVAPPTSTSTTTTSTTLPPEPTTTVPSAPTATTPRRTGVAPLATAAVPVAATPRYTG